MLVRHGEPRVRELFSGSPDDSPSEILKTWDPVTRCQIYDGVAGRYFGQPESILTELRRGGLSTIHSRTFKSSGWDMLEVIANLTPR